MSRMTSAERALLLNGGLRSVHELVRIDPKGGRVLLAWLQPRPHYCNRGRYSAGIERVGPDHVAALAEGCELHVAGQGIKVSQHDWWPRYYFDLAVAKSELAAWMTAHGVDLTGGVWEHVFYDSEQNDTRIVLAQPMREP